MNAIFAQVLLASSFTADGIRMAADVKTMLLAVLSTGAVWGIAKAAAKGVIAGILTAIVLGGVILWTAANLDTIKGKAGEQIDGNSMGSVVRVVPMPAELSTLS